MFRAIYYAEDRPAFFRRVASFTERKLVFDLNPRQYPVEQVAGRARAAGFARVELRPFFVPQTQRLPRPAVALLRALERGGPFARLALRVRFTYLVAAVRLARDHVERDAGAERAPLAAARPDRPRPARTSRVSTSTRHGPSGVGSATVRDAHAGT